MMLEQASWPISIGGPRVPRVMGPHFLFLNILSSLDSNMSSASSLVGTRGWSQRGDLQLGLAQVFGLVFPASHS